MRQCLLSLAFLLFLTVSTSDLSAGGDTLSGRVRRVAYLSPDHFSVELEVTSVPIGIDQKMLGQSIIVDLEYDPPWDSIWGHRKNGATLEQFRTGVNKILAALADQKIHTFGNMGNGLKIIAEPNRFKVTSLLVSSDGVVTFN